ncbi:MAG: hypothetical protein N3D81_02965 [Spirochaetes bacterium]|nr:hypothetical protein [Spirochaetota bacterium]
MIQSILSKINNFISGEISFEELSKTLRRYKILPNEKNKTFTVRIPSKFGVFSSEKIYKMVDLTKVSFIHLTTKQNIELQNIPPDQLLGILKDLNTIGLFPFETGISDFINVSYLTGINKLGVFDVLDIAILLEKTLSNYVSPSNLHPKFRIGISDSDEDLGLALISDVGLIAKVHNKTQGFEIFFGGSLGEVPRKGDLLFEFEDILNAVKRVVSLVLCLVDFGKVRAKRLIVAKGRDYVVNESEKYFKDIALLEDTTTYFNLLGDSSNGDTIRMKKVDKKSFVKFVQQKQEDMFFVESVVDNGDVESDLLKIFCFLSKNYGDGRLIVGNRQNLIVPNLHKNKENEIRSLLELLNVGVLNLEAQNIVSCTGTYSCNIAILNSKLLSEMVREEVKDTALRINISGCPNSSGHHHIGDIGVFTISEFRGRIKVWNVITFGGYGKNKLPIGRAFSKSLPNQTPHIIKTIIDAYKASGISFQDFVSQKKVELKKRVFETIISTSKHTLTDGIVALNPPVRRGSKLDEIYLKMFDVQLILYRVLKKVENREEDRFISHFRRIISSFMDSLPKIVRSKFNSFCIPSKLDGMLEFTFEVEDVLDDSIDSLRDIIISEEEMNERNSVYSW